jgi:hypothetical protein
MTGTNDMQKRRLSWRKRCVFILLTVLVLLPVVELLSFVGLHVSQRDFSFEKLRITQQAVSAGASASDGAQEVIHPYLGWVHNPQVAIPETIFDTEIPVNSLGFRDDGESVRQRGPDRYIVGILGGSVAWNVSIAGRETLIEGLGQHPALAGKQIEIVRLAVPGYKQPQQVMALSYVNVLGAEFDAVVNIDGYNEAALTFAENATMNTAVAYPRSWHSRMTSVVDPRSFADAATLLELRARRQTMATRMLGASFNWSPTANLIWLIRDERARSELTDLGLKVTNIKRESFVHHGPAADFADQQKVDQAIVDLWIRSSMQLQSLCRGSQTTYVHVLQPNQYLVGSKVLSEKEKQTAYIPGQVAGDAVERLYPQLREQAARLTDVGVIFSDQTMLFADIRDTIYSDPYCHYNRAGNEMLAAAIVQELIRVLVQQRDESGGGGE